ncbi:MAG: VPA1262 family N-terminal domain-containing protein [Aquabacterium sp.]|uniref:VPA1262 family N-terminal domain-containing protein n=1 Tax=Aquabacterium sp. TaxID=1872578 RepID=UPI003BAEE2DF
MNQADSRVIDPADFDCAIIRLVSIQRAKGEAGQLLFASVTLLARGRQRPPSSEGVERHKVAGSQTQLYFRRTVLTVEAALDWYRGLDTPTGNLTPTPQLAADRRGDLDGIRLVTSNLADRPAWPRLGVSFGRDLMFGADELADPCPFVGSTASRVHRRFGSVANFEDAVDDADCVRKLRRWIHVDLSRYPEYIGSAALIVPDPFVRRVDSFVVVNQSGGEDQVIRVVPRVPDGLRDLSLTLFERQAHLLSQFETHPVPDDGEIVISRDEAAGATGFVLSHEIYGPLQGAAATHYLRAVSFTTGIAEPSAIIEIAATDSPNSKLTTYRAASITMTRTMEVGKSSAQSTDVRIERAAFRRRQAFEASHYEQTWLEARDREAALRFVRSRIQRAKGVVLIADPYLGSRQIKQFMFAIPRGRVTVTLLTSRLAFESRHAENTAAVADATSPETGAPSPRADESSRLDAFRKEVEGLRAHTNGDIRVCVLPGNPPELHDRFLAVDESVWFFGGSFNGLGDRASLVIRLPQAEEILKRLEPMIVSSRTLEEHMALRMLAPDQAAFAAPGSSWWRVVLSRWYEALRKVTATFRKDPPK